MTRDKKTLDEKLQETQSALESEENKAKGEHRARLKLESNLQDIEEKMERENAVTSNLPSPLPLPDSDSSPSPSL